MTAEENPQQLHDHTISIVHWHPLKGKIGEDKRGYEVFYFTGDKPEDSDFIWVSVHNDWCIGDDYIEEVELWYNADGSASLNEYRGWSDITAWAYPPAPYKATKEIK